jgi:O-antigen ligase
MAEFATFAFDRPYRTHTLVLGLMVALGISMPTLLLMGQPVLYLAVLPGIAVALAILQTPRLGLYLTAATLPLDVAGNLVAVTTTFHISIAWICALLTLSSWLVSSVMFRQAPIWPREATALVLYLLVGIASLATAQEFDHGVEEVIHVTETILFFLMVVNLVRTRTELITTLGLLVAAAVGSFAYAIGQKLFLPHNIIQERGLDLLRPGAVTYGVELGRVDTYGLGSVQRVTGTTLHSGVLALDCAYMLPFIMVFQQLNSSLLKQLLGWSALLLTFGAFSTTLSRSGFLTLGFTLLMLALTGILRINGVRVVAMAIILLIGLMFVPAGYLDRVLSPTSYMASNSDSLNGRLELWTASLRAILDHPLTGFGLGNEHGIFDYWKPEQRNQLGTVLNTFLQIAIEIGIAGLAFFLLFTSMLFGRVRAGRRRWRALADAHMVMIGTAFLVLLLALISSWMTFEFMRGSFKNIWLLFGCMVAYDNIARTTVDHHAPVPRPLGPAMGSEQRT